MTSTFQPESGQVIGEQFRLERKLGEGGMGELYLAHQLELDRWVVLKFVHAHVVQQRPESEARLQQEARAIAQITHPNVVQLYTFGRHAGKTYLAMEYVRGHTLARELEQGPMSGRRALHIAKQIASGLSAAHAVGVVHRDLKPENVMLTEVGSDRDVVKLVDFGIAKLLHHDGTKLTRTGLVVGTPQYMAPEQIEAKPVDERSDIYCFGLILYELLTGVTTFSGSTPYELLTQHVSGQVTPPSVRTAGVSPALEAIVLCCLQKDPARRFASAVDLCRALSRPVDERAPSPLAVSARPPPPPPEVLSSARVPRPAVPTLPTAAVRAPTQAWRLWGLSLVVMMAWAGFVLSRMQAGWWRSLWNASQASFEAPAPRHLRRADGNQSSSPAGLPATSWSAASSIQTSAPEKQLAQAARCLNRFARAGYRSYARYDSWVNLREGPAPHAHVLGLYLLGPPAGWCDESQLMEHDEELFERTRELAVAIKVLDELTSRASRYYDDEDYLDDEMRLGQSMHAPLLAGFRAFAESEVALRAALVSRRTALDRALIGSLPADSPERLFHELRVAARELASFGSSDADRPLSPEGYAAALAAFSSLLERLEARGDVYRLSGDGRSMLAAAKKLHRSMGPHAGWRTKTRIALQHYETSSYGTPAGLLSAAEALIRGMSSASERMRGIVDVAPVFPYQPSASEL